MKNPERAPAPPLLLSQIRRRRLDNRVDRVNRAAASLPSFADNNGIDLVPRVRTTTWRDYRQSRLIAQKAPRARRQGVEGYCSSQYREQVSPRGILVIVVVIVSRRDSRGERKANIPAAVSSPRVASKISRAIALETESHPPPPPWVRRDVARGWWRRRMRRRMKSENRQTFSGVCRREGQGTRPAGIIKSQKQPLLLTPRTNLSSAGTRFVVQWPSTSVPSCPFLPFCSALALGPW